MALPLSYNWRNLLVRRLSTALTFIVVTVVVAVLAVLLSFAAGIHASLASSGSPRNIVALQTGATAESTSIITPEEAGRLVQTPGVARDERGQPLISQEICVQTNLPRRGNAAAPANVAVRGVDVFAPRVHGEVKLVDGRWFEPGQMEVIVGTAAHERYLGLGMGDTVELGRTANRRFLVVGRFSAGGGALESEIWAPLTSVFDSYSRRFISSAVLRLDDGADAEATLAYLRGPAVRLQAKRETDYYADLSTKTREIVGLTSILIAIMGAGAVFAVANTMYASVDSRRREIAMLRTIGFGRLSILSAFVLESLLICLVACTAGLGIAALASGSRQDFLSDATWTVLAYELRLTPAVLTAAIGVSTLVGIIGGLAPAIRASRVRVIEALRKA
jgi:ABC-type lipoprotein release transport system permease subunit